MEIKKYGSPASFKNALDDRLRKQETANRGIARLRQLVVYERFLARIVDEFADSVVLKGGFGLELRLDEARMTKDVDVRFSGDPERLLERLQRAGQAVHPDFMTFEVVGDKDHPDIQGEGAKYEGKRFKVTCKIAGIPYGSPFGLDVGVGDPMIQEPQKFEMPDRLSFIGISAPRVRIYPIETHLAEKLHAYTLPRPPQRPNSRDKDLIDIALISTLDIPSATTLRAAFVQTFEFRGTHGVPDVLPHPPSAWHALYPSKILEFALQWETLAVCYERAQHFVDPVLAGDHEARWDPASGKWQKAT